MEILTENPKIIFGILILANDVNTYMFVFFDADHSSGSVGGSRKDGVAVV